MRNISKRKCAYHTNTQFHKATYPAVSTVGDVYNNLEICKSNYHYCYNLLLLLLLLFIITIIISSSSRNISRNISINIIFLYTFYHTFSILK